VAAIGSKLIVDAKIFPSPFVLSGYQRALGQRLAETNDEVPRCQSPIPSPEGGLGEDDR
jgi:hypothetical protein